MERRMAFSVIYQTVLKALISTLSFDISSCSSVIREMINASFEMHPIPYIDIKFHRVIKYIRISIDRIGIDLFHIIIDCLFREGCL